MWQEEKTLFLSLHHEQDFTQAFLSVQRAGFEHLPCFAQYWYHQKC
jgi:hypothetical protein